MSPASFRLALGLLLPMVVANLVAVDAIVVGAGLGGTVGNNLDATYSTLGNVAQSTNNVVTGYPAFGYTPVVGRIGIPVFGPYGTASSFGAAVGPAVVGNNIRLYGSSAGDIFQTTNNAVGPYGFVGANPFFGTSPFAFGTTAAATTPVIA